MVNQIMQDDFLIIDTTRNLMPATQQTPRSIDTYLKDKLSYYEEEGKRWSVLNKDPVVGSYDQNNAWADYDDFLFKGIETKETHALEYACGVGRNIIRFANRFKQIDGVDISPEVIKKAEENIGLVLQPLPKLWVNDGKTLNGVDNGTYDIVYSTIAMQHLASHSLRQDIMAECFRVLKPGGWYANQMGYSNPPNTDIAQYFDEYLYDFKDVEISNTDDLKADLVLLGFKQETFSFDIRPKGPGEFAHENWIYWRIQK